MALFSAVDFNMETSAAGRREVSNIATYPSPGWTSTFVPVSSLDSAVKYTVTVQPATASNAGAGMNISYNVEPTAANGSATHYGLFVDNVHAAGAFATNLHIGVFSRVHQNLAATTMADARGYHGQVAVSAGTVTAADGIRGQITVQGGTVTTGISVHATRFHTSGTFTTSIGVQIDAASGTVGTDIALRSLGAMTNARVQADVNDAIDAALEEAAGSAYEIQRRTEQLTDAELALEAHQFEAEALAVEIERLQEVLDELDAAGEQPMFNREQRRSKKRGRR